MKIIKIDSCWDCPYVSISPDKNSCRKVRRFFALDDSIFPDWCPLPDAPDTTSLIQQAWDEVTEQVKRRTRDDRA